MLADRGAQNQLVACACRQHCVNGLMFGDNSGKIPLHSLSVALHRQSQTLTRHLLDSIPQ